MFRAIIFGLVIYFVYKTIKTLMINDFQGNKNDRGRYNTDNKSDTMIKDPQCGVYFPEKDGIKLRHDGQTLIFCSEKCRDDFLSKK